MGSVQSESSQRRRTEFADEVDRVNNPIGGIASGMTKRVGVANGNYGVEVQNIPDVGPGSSKRK